MATYLDGNVRKATANTVTAMRRSAETRTCPSCGRRSALRKTGATDYVGAVMACRWAADGRCDYDETAARRHMIDLYGDDPALADGRKRHQRRLDELTEDTAANPADPGTTIDLTGAHDTPAAAIAAVAGAAAPVGVAIEEAFRDAAQAADDALATFGTAEAAADLEHGPHDHCGTRKGYRYHRETLGEPACPACNDANNQAARDLAAARGARTGTTGRAPKHPCPSAQAYRRHRDNPADTCTDPVACKAAYNAENARQSRVKRARAARRTTKATRR